MIDDLQDLKARIAGGDAAAMRNLGKRQLFGDGIRPSPGNGIALIKEAARRQDGEATALVARLAAWGVMQKRDLSGSLDLLRNSAELGWEDAAAELSFLARAVGGDFASMREQIDLRALTAPRPSRALLESPRIRIFQGFALHEECDWVIARLKGGLQRALVYSGSPVGKPAATRTNSEAGFMLKAADIVLCCLRDRIAASLRVAPEFCEVTKLLHYSPGEAFSLHSDYFDPNNANFRDELAQRGQRFATFLIYLNDDYEGGETDFPAAGFRFKGRKGDALLFLNVNNDGTPEPLSVHAGLPPTRGEKWLLSQWIGSRPLNVYLTSGEMPPPLGQAWLRAI
jgi:hypothetical protein